MDLSLIMHCFFVVRTTTVRYLIFLTSIAFGAAFLFLGHICQNIMQKDSVLKRDDSLVSYVIPSYKLFRVIG